MEMLWSLPVSVLWFGGLLGYGLLGLAIAQAAAGLPYWRSSDADRARCAFWTTWLLWPLAVAVFIGLNILEFVGKCFYSVVFLSKREKG